MQCVFFYHVGKTLKYKVAIMNAAVPFSDMELYIVFQLIVLVFLVHNFSILLSYRVVFTKKNPVVHYLLSTKPQRDTVSD